VTNFFFILFLVLSFINIGEKKFREKASLLKPY